MPASDMPVEPSKVGGDDVAAFVSVAQFVERAKQVLDPSRFVWADAGSGQEVTAERNVRALNRLALVSSVLVDVADIDLSTSFVGVPLDFPIVMAPVGAVSIYHPDRTSGAEVAARAAAESGTSSICSMLVSEPWEALAATAPGRHFFQMYVGGDRAWLAEVIARVEAAQFAGIVVTADAPVIGRRDRALLDGYAWHSEALDGVGNLADHGYDLAYRTRLTWDDMEWICANTSLPVVLKGVLAVDDARRAVACGTAGVYVSNHGGRTLDQAVSTIEVLAEIVEAVDGAADVMIDGGFSSGTDVCKAVALGASAVGLGRLQCWALAAGGQPGVQRLLEILRQEMVTSMTNLGCDRIAALGPDRVRWSIPTI